MNNINKLLILKHNSGTYHIVPIQEWNSKYNLDEYIPLSNADNLDEAELYVKHFKCYDYMVESLNKTLSANKVIESFRKNPINSLDIPVFVNGKNIKDIQLQTDENNNHFFNIIIE